MITDVAPVVAPEGRISCDPFYSIAIGESQCLLAHSSRGYGRGLQLVYGGISRKWHCGGRKPRPQENQVTRMRMNLALPLARFLTDYPCTHRSTY